MIIRTRRSSFGYAFDVLLTAIAWLGFCYLVSHSIMLLYSNYAEAWFDVRSNLDGVIFCMTATILFSLFFLIWAHFRARHPAQNVFFSMDDEARAVKYHLPFSLLNDATQSRLTIIHHSNNGDIVGIETGSYDALLQIK